MLKLCKSLKRICTVIKNRGEFEYLYTFMGSVLGKICYRVEMKIFEKLINKETIIYNDEYYEYSIKKLNCGNLNILQNIAGPLLMSKFKKNLSSGNMCFIVLYNDDIVGYSWIDFDCSCFVSYFYFLP